jgi:uracil-DNA glycosylase
VGEPQYELPIDVSVTHLQRAGRALARHRRDDGSLLYQPEDPAAPAALAYFLDAQQLRGLFLGQCGWSDLSALIRGPDMESGCKLMILGNDWYPLTRCANFFTERMELDKNGTLNRFLRELRRAASPDRPPRKPTTDDLSRFIHEQRVYLGNALSCFRTGWETTGGANLSLHSFDHCSPLIAAHIHALRPSVLVTFGANSCASVAALATTTDPELENTLAQLRHANRNVPLGVVMTAYNAATPNPAGLPLRIGDHPFRHVPLYHPSFAHLNSYPADYTSLLSTLELT